MKKFKNKFLVSAAVVSIVASINFIAGPVFGSSEMSKFEKKAASFMLLKVKSLPSVSAHTGSPAAGNCTVGASLQCVEFVAGSYPSNDERLKAVRACRANQDSECVIYVAGSYPSFGEREDSAKSCANNYGKACAEYVAGSYASLSERTAAAVSCENAEVECVKFVAGSYPSASERIQAAKACGGN